MNINVRINIYATVAEVAGWEDYSFPEISSER